MDKQKGKIVMGVYVDDLQPCLTNKNWRHNKSCHLIADGFYELHEFAEKLGLKQAWFQNENCGHYDLTENKRKVAVEKGAVELGLKEFVAKLQKIRERRKAMDK